MRRDYAIGAAFLVSLVVLGIGQAALDRVAAEGKSVQAPRFEVDPMWPKPLPNHWLLATSSASAWISRITSGSCTVA